MNDKKPGLRKQQAPRNFGSMSSEEYIAERLNPMRAWYDKKALRSKRAHQFIRLIIILGGAHVPVLINMPDTKIVSTCLSLLVVVLIAFESVFHFREQWKSYRSTEQLLAREYIHYVTGQAHYLKNSSQEAFPTFVQNIESILTAEHSMTINLMTAPHQPNNSASTVSSL
jgi:hypothetical protein